MTIARTLPLSPELVVGGNHHVGEAEHRLEQREVNLLSAAAARVSSE